MDRATGTNWAATTILFIFCPVCHLLSEENYCLSTLDHSYISVYFGVQLKTQNDTFNLFVCTHC